MQDRIRRPAVGDPDRAARLREIALKAAAKRRANIAAGIAPKRRTVKEAVADAVRRFFHIPVMDEVASVTECEHTVAASVTECEHTVADLFAIVRAARGEGEQQAEQPKRFYCAGCVRVGRSGNPNRHHANGNIGKCEASRCECPSFEQGREFAEPVARERAMPQTITVSGKTYSKLGNGASRVTYDLGCGKHALKTLHRTNVGFGADAMPWQAKAECDFFEQTPDEDRKFLASIEARSADYSTEVVEKVAQKRPDDGEDEMRRWADRRGIRDLHAANVGWRNGRMVILDFGFAPRER